MVMLRDAARRNAQGAPAARHNATGYAGACPACILNARWQLQVHSQREHGIYNQEPQD